MSNTMVGSNSMTENKRKIRFRIIMALSCLSFSLVVGEQILNSFMYKRIGLDHKIAGHNFYYNFTYFFPIWILALIISIIALTIYLKICTTLRKENVKLNWFERLTIVPSTVPLIGIILFMVSFLYIIIRT